MNTWRLAPASPAPAIVVSPATRPGSTVGGGGGATTVATSERALTTSPMVWLAWIAWPGARAKASASVHVPPTPTATFPAPAPSTKTVRVAPAVPRPLTLVLPATIGVVRTGAGGGAMTVAGAERALDTPLTACA